ncbi:MAG: hypothetical protein UX13_C0004G0007 [Candidatus Woesebacteria bacterium GW2011_GWB1_45_5]|uniref:Uncharacterized protein n=1 Tax=Candidatus Woesebacteria bacterium GW2011_GWB1_45_5 TaxID=1618581 RepID=A0A0G1QQ54_9BACT|nr:MAG: hypothetical protein UX13_C0004G0007 [Candidatus Woesebacteria bacterium GW2011_GWB1_45_5]
MAKGSCQNTPALEYILKEVGAPINPTAPITPAQITQLAQSEFLSGYTPAPYSSLNLNNYTICGGDQGCNLFLTSAETGLNTGTFGTFNNYTQTYQNINIDNTDASYLERAFTEEGFIASAQLGTTLVMEGAVVSSLPGVITTAVTAGTTRHSLKQAMP